MSTAKADRQEALTIVDIIASSQKSDPFLRNRLITHYNNGIISIHDLREGTTQ